MHRTCSVCLAPYEAGDEVRTVLCMHKVRINTTLQYYDPILPILRCM
jgi:hypothetical protein